MKSLYIQGLQLAAFGGNDRRCSSRLHWRSSEKSLSMNELDRRISVAPMMDWSGSSKT
jgi:hypothetical protein